MKPAFLDDLMEKISNVLPHDLQSLKEDTQKNVRAVLQSVFEKMDLVTREEFDVQKKVLERAQQQIQQLALEIQALEKTAQDKK